MNFTYKTIKPQTDRENKDRDECILSVIVYSKELNTEVTIPFILNSVSQ